VLAFPLGFIMAKKEQLQTFVIITGMSGAGKSTALNTLEDIGFETIDNLPIVLFSYLLELKDSNPLEKEPRPVAIGVDVRTRAFDIEIILKQLAAFKENKLFNFKILFMECDDSSLERRFSETRRRHPLAIDRPVIDGITDERRILESFKSNSDIILDTSGLSIHDTKRRLKELFRQSSTPQISIECLAFGFSKGAPKNADLVFDVRFLQNPHYNEALRLKTGKDKDVAVYIMKDKNFKPFLIKISNLVLSLLPLYRQEGKSYLTIAFGCTGGRHRSVCTAIKMGEVLTKNGYRVNIAYRDI
jgi:RNase adapter protein RapZ